MVKQTVLAQALAMIRGHDDQGPLERATTLQFVEKNTQLFVDVPDTIIIGIASQSNRGAR